ncbi:HEPN domain-containing protein [Kiloniella sp.]|uniref:HEPN domain-containing protein n=1 Tax=Kiloniella sp. TaxID=1938587 RepID=UPI003A911CE3
MSWRVKYQADDFFEAYQVLKKHNKFGSPSVVNLAFAVELYIKDLHFTLLGNIPRGHNILELYRELPDGIKQEIRSFPAVQKGISFYSMQLSRRYVSEDKNKQLFTMHVPEDKNEQPITDILEQQIYKISDAFVTWRYAHEKSNLRYDEGFALAFIEAVVSTTNKVRKHEQ